MNHTNLNYQPVVLPKEDVRIVGLIYSKFIVEDLVTGEKTMTERFILGDGQMDVNGKEWLFMTMDNYSGGSLEQYEFPFEGYVNYGTDIDDEYDESGHPFKTDLEEMVIDYFVIPRILVKPEDLDLKKHNGRDLWDWVGQYDQR